MRGGEGFAPIHDAAFHGRVDLIQMLLDSGADMNARSNGGETPLGTAVRAGRAEAAAFLRGKGAKERKLEEGELEKLEPQEQAKKD